MTVSPVATVAGATRQPLPYGLFSVLTFREGDGSPRWLNNIDFESLDCTDLGGTSGPACVGEPTGFPRTFTSAYADGEASAFTIYGTHVCSPIGQSFTESEQFALERLYAFEERRVEQAFWTGDLGNTPSLQDAGTTTLATGTAQDPAVGLGMLEQFIAETYGALGTIHMTRQAATYLEDHLNGSGRVLTTKLGTPVVAGSGYPGTGPAGQAVTGAAQWIYATPALFGHRTSAAVTTGRPGDLLDRAVNDLYSVAERSYLLGFDPCGVAAVLINPTL